MKSKVFALIAFLLVSASLLAQESETKSKFAYSNITEFGFFAASPRSFFIEGTTVQGVSIEKQHHLGLGIGMGWGNCKSFWNTTVHTPIFVNYRYYFSTDKKFLPHLNASLGGVAIEDGGGLYSALMAGFISGKFSFSSGLSFMAVYKNEYRDWWYEEPYYDYSQWHFPFGVVLKCGFSF